MSKSEIGATLLGILGLCLRSVIACMVIGIAFLTVCAFIKVTYDRETVAENLGTGIGDYLYGICDPAYQAFVSRRMSPSIMPAAPSQRFRVRRPASPIARDEEAQVIGFIELAFGWKVTADIGFDVSFDETGIATFYPRPAVTDQFTIDECGYLIGDDYPTRLRHSEHAHHD